MSIYFLESSHLKFRVWAEDDIAHAMKVWGNAEVSLHFGGPYPLKHVCKILLQEIKKEKRTHVQIWPVFKDGRFIGACGLKRHWLKKGEYQLYILFEKEHWRYAYVQEATEKIVAYAFEIIKAKKLTIVNDPYNVKFESLLKQIHFEFSHKCYDGSLGIMNYIYVLSHELGDANNSREQ